MNMSQSIQMSFVKSLSRLKKREGLLYVLIIILALAAFEAFNYSTTDFALSDLLGDLRFVGVRWATLLSIAFCGIDFAGIARLFTPQTGKEEPRSAWFMFGAWILAATMNAILTWWGVVMAMQTHPVLSAGMVDPEFVTSIVPIFIALMVWVIRILLIGTLSKKGDRLINEARQSNRSTMSQRELRQAQSQAAHASASKRTASVPSVSFKSAPKSKVQTGKRGYRPEPKYIPMQDEVVYHAVKASGSGQRRV